MFVIGSLMLVICACLLGVIFRFATRPLRTPVRDLQEASWDNQFPFRRLLDSGDFYYLKASGFPKAALKKFKAQRRKIALHWLHNLASDFNRVDSSAKLLLVHSQSDRPALAAQLCRQRALFCWHFLRAEAQIIFSGRAGQSLQSHAPLDTLEILCSETRKLVDALQLVPAVSN